MITPFKVYQRRITDNDDEIDFEAICEPSGNDRVVAGKYPNLTPEESDPNMVRLESPYFPVTRLAVACSSDVPAFLSDILHKISLRVRYALGFNLISMGAPGRFFSLPPPSCV